MIMLYGSQRDYDAMVGRAADGTAAWSQEDVVAMHEFMGRWNQELVDSGEFVDAHGLAAPLHTRRLELRGGAPVVTDGPYAETQEVLAGYTIVECESFDRATEIAARIAKCPTPGGVDGAYVEVRPVDDAPPGLEL
ncbi:MAG TPA: YciI family protein [Streptosporangiaceae bacterium]